MPDRHYFRCLVCGSWLEPAIETEDDTNTPVHDGLHFRAHGNYGSGIFDPGPGRPESHLEVVVCDRCVRERAVRVRLYLKDGTARPFSRKAANP